MPQKRYARVGVIGALEKEVATIFEHLAGAERAHCDGLDIATGRLGSLEVSATVAGMGTVNAAAATQALISRYNVDAVVFSGIAGGLNPALHIEDVVVGGTLRYLDTDTALVAESAPGLEEFSSTPELVEVTARVLEARGYALVNESASSVNAPAVASSTDAPATDGKTVTSAAAAETAPDDAPIADAPLRYLLGTIATGDRFITGADVKREVIAATNADCVEMEGAAIAHVAAKNGVDCLILRAISDNCDEAYDALSSRSFDLEDYARNASGIVLDILRELDSTDRRALRAPSPPAHHDAGGKHHAGA